jgi:hypothetical protein
MAVQAVFHTMRIPLEALRPGVSKGREIAIALIDPVVSVMVTGFINYPHPACYEVSFRPTPITSCLPVIQPTPAGSTLLNSRHRCRHLLTRGKRVKAN